MIFGGMPKPPWSTAWWMKLYKIKFIQKDKEPVYLIGKYNTFKQAFDVAKSLAKASLLKYEVKERNIEYENGDILEIEIIPFTRKNIR